MSRLTFENLWMNGQWQSDVTIELQGSRCRLRDEENGRSASEGGEYVHGLTIPGLENAHCHAFQRILPSWTQRAGPAQDSFWTWREVMYAAAQFVSLQDLEAIAARCYLDLLRGGYTGVAEFLYLHRLGADLDDAPNADLAISAAARRVGISLTLVPALYQHSDFGHAPARPQQRLFVRPTDRFVEDWNELRRRYVCGSSISLGLAFHSLRAVDIDTVEALCTEIASDQACRAVHMHICEQQAEVAACLQHWGRSPIELLFARGLVDRRWTLVHGTHASRAELEGICGRNATLALCPTTEADLGDGCPDLAPFLLGSGHLAIGSDSNVCCNAFSELRLLEWSQRLRYQRRNVLASAAEPSVADRLYRMALAGGRAALGTHDQDAVISADFVTFEDDAGSWREQPRENWLSALVFGCGEPRARHVMVNGHWRIRDGVHEHEAEIEHGYRAALSRLGPRLIEARRLANQNGDQS